MNAKQCFKCGEVKDLSCFYRHPMMKDGRVNKCKNCNKKDVKNNRLKNLEYYRAYDRARGARTTKESYQRYWSQNPEKRAAHNALNNALRCGRVCKPDYCEECGVEHWRLHGHHDDYAFPLSVRWLCPGCHFAWHSENGEGAS